MDLYRVRYGPDASVYVDNDGQSVFPLYRAQQAARGCRGALEVMPAR